jgi:hypothetical protein
MFGGCKADENADEKGQERMVDRLKTQCLIMRSATGESMRGGDKVSQQRRQANWLLWYYKDNSNGAKEFEQIDLPLIAKEFSKMWAVNIDVDEQGRIRLRILAGVAREIREILRRCNRIPRRTREGYSIPDHQVPSKLISPPVNKRKRSPEDGSQEDDTTVDSTKKLCATPRGLPLSLTLNVLREGDLDELAAIEYAVHLIFSKKFSVELAMDSSVPKPKSISLEDLHKVRETLRPTVLKNLLITRRELLDGLPVGLFRPNESDMLHAWMTDGKCRRYFALFLQL